ncbi:response regulator [Allocoleopsis franciscana]|uniref:histidine kinase n=1 Tax=Allocoleopsis franciscana PCC 7113 TaxID=1173027 RepID=K9WEU8_9CYAN|nr:response regulator [Allocoleopsis franciscana]AFZ18733.1 chemotaxis protein histidine kinase-like protein [Allocoleopsis franciscana PCC 7113]
MQSEQQQRIMGYFIEEAKDHLNTIEQGLLSLQSTMEDREMLNEIFRAAHSVKGGAAMLGINSIQQTAHRLEDCFKTLQESSVKPDNQLESLFLRVFDTLQALVEQLQSPFGLSDDTAGEIMSDAEPVFEELHTHLETLVQTASDSPAVMVEAPKVTLANSQMNTANPKPLPANFKRDVLIELREMLQLFKQQDLPEHREALQAHCLNLVRLGEPQDLPGWDELLETARVAIACSANSYRLLANIVIKEIKQAQELVIAGRSVEICASEQLNALVPESHASEIPVELQSQESEFDRSFDQDFAPDAQESETLESHSQTFQDESESSLTHLFDGSDTEIQSDLQDYIPETLVEGDSASSPAFIQSEQQKTRRIYRFAAPSEPEVGVAELNTLADIFEGQMPDLDETWQDEEVINLDDNSTASYSGNSFSLDEQSDFSDLVSDLDSLNLSDDASTSEDLMDLFGDESLEEVVPHTPESSDSNWRGLDAETPLSTTDSGMDDFSDLLFEEDSPDPVFASSRESEDLSNLFGDSFFEENSLLEQDLDDFDLEADPTSQLQHPDDDLFAMPMADVFASEPEEFSNETEALIRESFPTQDNEFFDWEDSSQPLENLEDEAIGLDSVAPTQSDMDFGELTEISANVGGERPHTASPASGTAPDPELSDEPVIDNQATVLGWEELDESTADFDFDTQADFNQGKEVGDLTPVESLQFDDFGLDADTADLFQPSDLSLDDSFFDTSTSDIPAQERESFSDLALENFMSTDELSGVDDWNWDEENEIPLDEAATFELGGDLTDPTTTDLMPESLGQSESEADDDLSSWQDSATEESFWDVNQPESTSNEFELAGRDAEGDASALDFDFEETSSDAFNFEVNNIGDRDDLLEDEALSTSMAAQSAALQALEAFEDLLETPTQEAATQASEGLEFSDLDQIEAHSELDDLNGFLNAEDVSEADARSPINDDDDGSFWEETHEPSDSQVEQPLNFEDFSLFDIPEASDNAGVASLQESALPEETFEDLLFESSASEEDQSAELSDAFFDTPENDLFDLEFTEASSAERESAALDASPVSDFEAMFGDESSGETDSAAVEAPTPSDFDLSSLSANDSNADADSWADNSSSLDWAFEAGEETTAEAQTPLFEWDEADSAVLEGLEVSVPDASVESRALDSPSASDFDGLLGDGLFGDSDSFDVSESATDHLFDTEIDVSEEQPLTEEAVADDLLNFDWEGTGATESENFEDVFSSQTDEVPEAETWDDLLSATQESDVPDTELTALSDDEVDTPVQAAAFDFEALEDETTTELNLDWETQESDHLFTESEADAHLDATAAQDSAADRSQSLEFDDLESMLDGGAADNSQSLEFDDLESMLDGGAADNSQALEFDDLESMLGGGEELAISGLDAWDTTSGNGEFDGLDEFADLEAMLAEAPSHPTTESSDLDVFQDLDSLLEDQTQAPDSPAPAPVNRATSKASSLADEFGDLESLLKQADKSLGGPPSAMPDQSRTRPSMRPRPPRVFEHTMRVPVKHLDSLSNLVGELVVNRNTLEQDQERLRQFLDNLSHQVLALSDVGARMQDLYERSLLESSLLASRPGHRSPGQSDLFSLPLHHSGEEYDPLEMDRFTGFHLLSQEMIELIVRVRESASDIEFLVDETDQVARMLRQITTQLQEGLTRARMVPFAQNADRLLRAVHEISRKLGKEAQLQVEGRETLIDKMILEHLYDPMTHLVNNALTHGIESPEVRKAARKPPVGRVTLRAFHQGNQTVISISDDGAGIDAERVRSKAIQQRLIKADDAKTLTNVELYDCLFHPGFSTKDKADDFSGRGVGMDVVRTSLSEIRGTIHIDSTVGKGTTFTIRLPLTLSICKALCCLSDRARIAFPMDGVEDMMDILNDRVQTNAEGQSCIQWRDTLLPFHSLSDLLTYKRQLSRNTVYGGKREDDMISIVVLRSAGNFLAIQVDQVLGEQEIVIKQLEGPPPKPVGIAGATVLGDGRIMAIADVLELIDLANGRIRKDGGVTLWPREEPQVELPGEIIEAKSEPMVLIVDDSITVRELLSMTFSKSGYRVEQARDGQEAWDKLRSGLPCDIVFCDIEMPRMDGLELLSRLQKDEKLANLPIAMLTSRGADRHRQMASQLGASGYFTKPYLEEVLLDAAQRMIKGEVLFNSNA